MSIGPEEIILVLIIALLVFGPKRLPQMGRSLGRGVREFRKAAETAKNELGLGEVSDQINEVKEVFTAPLKDVTSTISEPLDQVRGTIGDLKAGVSLATGGAAGAASAAKQALTHVSSESPQPQAALGEGPETPPVTPQTVFADVAPPITPAEPAVAGDVPPEA